MASTQQVAELQTDSSPDASFAPGRRRFVQYLLWATLVPLVVWISAFPLVCSRSYEQWGETQWGPVLEFPYEAGTPDADVVIWGDSSAFIGVDPILVNQQLGIRSVVLPSTVGSLPVIGDKPLRTYLAHHPQPKLIVLFFSPWNLDFNHMAPGRHFEGEEMMLRHGSRSEILGYMLRHPFELLAFPLRVYSTFGSKMVVSILHGKSRAHDTAASLGHAPFLDPFGPLEDLCRIPSPFVKQHSDETVAALRRQYEAPGTQVMVYLAPVPHCTNSAAVHDRSYPGLDAAPPAMLPPPYFAADPYYAHIRPDSVPRSTAVFAGALKSWLQKNAPQLLGKGDGSPDPHAAAPER